MVAAVILEGLEPDRSDGLLVIWFRTVRVAVN